MCAGGRLYPEGQCQAEFSGIVAPAMGRDMPEEDLIGASRARDVLSQLGWLARQPAGFREEVLQRAVPAKFGAGDVVYRLGDPIGGIYGVVSGALVASVAPPRALPQILHVLTPGDWTGEGSFLSREPRRIELRSVLDTQVAYLPLDAMDQMAARDPSAMRNFVQILMMNLDIVLHAFHDLQDPDEHRRVARALRRIAAVEHAPIPLAQAALGLLANVSRKTVNAALQRFAKAGWIRKAYRSVTITDMQGLTGFAENTAD
jgi:CRP/FNR family cyclic AMP-dependent transcriptional regulator